MALDIPVSLKLRAWQLAQFLIGGSHTKRKIALSHLKDGVRVLEVGCSTGNVSNVFRSVENLQFVGLDIHQEAIALASHWHRHDDRFQFLAGDLRNLTDRIGMFDYVLFAAVLHHVNDDDARQMLKVAAGHVAPKGRIVLMEPLPAEANDTLLVKFYEKIDRGEWFRSRDELLDLVQCIDNFEILDDRVYPCSPFPFGGPMAARMFVLELAFTQSAPL